jgi:hypothetical protein
LRVRVAAIDGNVHRLSLDLAWCNLQDGQETSGLEYPRKEGMSVTLPKVGSIRPKGLRALRVQLVANDVDSKV